MKSKITKYISLPLLLVITLVISLAGCDSAEDHIGEAKIPSNQKQMKGEQYLDVVEDFESAGFLNVKLEKLDDLITGWMTKDGEVEKVSVGAKEDFSSGEWVSNDIEVIITYHTFSDEKESAETEEAENSIDDDELINPPYSQTEARYLDYKIVEEAFKNAGFDKVNSRLTHMSFEQELKETAKPGEVASISIGNSYVNDTSVKYSRNDAVYIEYYVLFSYDPLDELVSDTELTEYYAKSAFEKYAESQYPNGIKCHWVTDLLNAEQNIDGAWFLKVGITITKSDGSKYEAVAEGTVGGTDKNAKVNQFHVND